jgi:hypothetical protein
MNITPEYVSLIFVLCILLYTWLDSNNYNFNDLLNVKIEEPKRRKYKKLLYKENKKQTTENSRNINYDHIYNKIGIPTRFDKQNLDYIWDVPTKYPFYQVRSNIQKDKVMISINIRKPLILNLDNLNSSLDSKNGMLWVHGSTWEEAIIYLYYSLFNINDEKLMAKSKYILEHNQNFERKLINDIRLKLTELKSYNYPDYSQSEYNADVGMLKQPPMKPNKHIVQQMLNQQPKLQEYDIPERPDYDIPERQDYNQQEIPDNNQHERQDYNQQQMQNIPSDVKPDMTISLENEMNNTENNAGTDENGTAINLDSDWNWLPGIDGQSDTFYNL